MTQNSSQFFLLTRLSRDQRASLQPDSPFGRHSPRPDSHIVHDQMVGNATELYNEFLHEFTFCAECCLLILGVAKLLAVYLVFES